MVGQRCTRFEIKDVSVFSSLEGVSSTMKTTLIDRLPCRKYRVDLETLMVEYSPHRGQGSFSLHDIGEVREGLDTDVFNKIEQNPDILAG